MFYGYKMIGLVDIIWISLTKNRGADISLRSEGHWVLAPNWAKLNHFNIATGWDQFRASSM